MKFLQLPASHSLLQNVAIIALIGLAVWLTDSMLPLIFLIVLPGLPAFDGTSSLDDEDEGRDEDEGEYSRSNMGFTGDVDQD